VAATQLFIGQIPRTAVERQVLRERAIDVLQQLRQANQPAPSVVLLHFDAPPGASRVVDLLLVRPRAVIVGMFWHHSGPFEVEPGGGWRDIISGALLADPAGNTPLELARTARNTVVEYLRDTAEGLPQLERARVVGAVICVPTTHPAARISLDVDEHRQGLKVLGMDELAGVAAMVQSGVELSERQMAAVAGEVCGGRLWYDGDKPLFELAPPRFALRLLHGDRAGEVVPLPEGQTIVGRRRTPRHYERRVPILGDDLISSDHVVLEYGDDEGLVVRDISKNGTWITAPGEHEHHLHGAERRLLQGGSLRIGMTRLLIEPL
jgi:hypothetical protein